MDDEEGSFLLSYSYGRYTFNGSSLFDYDETSRPNGDESLTV